MLQFLVNETDGNAWKCLLNYCFNFLLFYVRWIVLFFLNWIGSVLFPKWEGWQRNQIKADFQSIGNQTAIERVEGVNTTNCMWKSNGYFLPLAHYFSKNLLEDFCLSLDCFLVIWRWVEELGIQYLQLCWFQELKSELKLNCLNHILSHYEVLWRNWLNPLSFVLSHHHKKCFSGQNEWTQSNFRPAAFSSGSHVFPLFTKVVSANRIPHCLQTLHRAVYLRGRACRVAVSLEDSVRDAQSLNDDFSLICTLLIQKEFEYLANWCYRANYWNLWCSGWKVRLQK